MGKCDLPKQVMQCPSKSQQLVTLQFLPQADWRTNTYHHVSHFQTNKHKQQQRGSTKKQTELFFRLSYYVSPLTAAIQEGATSFWTHDRHIQNGMYCKQNNSAAACVYLLLCFRRFVHILQPMRPGTGRVKKAFFSSAFL